MRDWENSNRQNQNLLLVVADSISTLKLWYPRCSHQKQKQIFEDMFDDISKHSLKSLDKMEVCDFPKGLLSKFSTPRPDVISVTLNGCEFGDDSWLLSKIFPKLCHLKIFYSNNITHSGIITHWPYLKALDLVGIAVESSQTEFESFLNLNPQLTSCVYKNCYIDAINWNLIQFIAENTQLEKFKFCSEFPAPNIHFKNVKHFVYFGNGDNFPFTFDRLEKLKLRVDDNIGIDDIIKRNPKLLKLSLSLSRASIFAFLSRELANLREITFYKRDWIDYKRDLHYLAKFLNEKSSALIVKLKPYKQRFPKYLENLVDKRKWNHIYGKNSLQFIRNNV